MSQPYNPMVISSNGPKFGSQASTACENGIMEDGELVKHPSYYQDNRVLVFRAENTLFRVPLGPLLQHSEGFHAIFTLAQGTEAPEGTEERPAYIPGTAEEFADFLGWAQHVVWNPPPLSEKFLVNILHFCHMWIIKPGRQYAIHELEKLNLPPARMLELALRFAIPGWVGPAVTKLIDIPLITHDHAQVQRIGDGFEYVAKARETLMLERLCMGALAFPVPANPGVNCQSHARCNKVWADVWFKRVARDLLHPVTPLSFDNAITHISSMDFPGMTTSCKDETIYQIILSDRFGVQRRITETTISAILNAYELQT